MRAEQIKSMKKEGQKHCLCLMMKKKGKRTHSQETTDRSRYAKLNPNTMPMASVRMKDLENR